MDPLLDAVAGREISIIEDAAQAIGAKNERNRWAGTIGSLGCFSFFASKNLGAFGAGDLASS